MEDAKDANHVVVEPIKDAVAIAHERTDSGTEIGTGRTAVGISAKPLESDIEIFLISVRSRVPIPRGAFVANGHEVIASRPAQDDLSHAARDVRRLFPQALPARRAR